MENDKLESGVKGGILSKIRMRFGEVAKRLGLVSSSDIEDALVKQESDTFRRRIGEVLVDDRKITTDHVEEVLKVQKEWVKDSEVKQEPAKATAKKPVKKTVEKKTARAAAKKPAKKTVEKKTARAAAKKPAKKTVKKKIAKTVARKPAKAKSTRKKSSKPKKK